MAGVLGMGPRIPVAVMVAAAVLAVSLHAGAAVGAVQAAVFRDFAMWARDVNASIANKLAQSYDVEVLKEKEKEPEPPPEPPKEEPKILVKAPKDEPPPPPPAAADAAKVLTQEPAKEEPVDLTANTFVSGNADTAVGGVTQVGGTAKTPTQNLNAVAGGVQGGTGAATNPVVKVDRSRSAMIKNLDNLRRCPFPSEADADQIDSAIVGIDVRVSQDGRAESVAITTDPGHGFAREARKCAMREKYDPALNSDGQAMPGVYRVRFKFDR